MNKALFVLALLASINCIANPLTANSHRLLPQKPKKTTTNKGAHSNALVFIENVGQVVDQNGKHRNDIDYKLETDDMVLFVGDGQLHYQWRRQNSEAETTISKAVVNHKSAIANVELYRMDVTPLGANKNAKVMAEEKQGYYENYYLPQFPDGALAHCYKRIIYKDVYPNIDWVLYVTASEAGRKSLKHEFVVKVGGNPADIKLQYSGATKLALVGGELLAETPYGKITENAPYTYYADTKQEIPSSFKLDHNILTYNINQPQTADHKSQIVIDPTLKWATYYGGWKSEVPCYSTMDTAGNVYLAGLTNSINNIATTGAYQVAVPVNTNYGFLAKFDINGVCQWGTYYGSVGEGFYAVCTDPQGNVYAGGGSGSTTGVTTSGTHQPTIGGGLYDALLVKFNSSGARQWATYYGGNGYEDITTLAADANGHICLGGRTTSTNAIATSGGFQTTPANHFVAMFDTAGMQQWGTYFNANVNAVAFDPFGDLYFCGERAMASNIATAGAYKSDVLGYGDDAFLVKFNSAGSRIWGTFYGGRYSDRAYAVACDNAGNVYIGGSTESVNTANDIATPGAFETTLVGNYPAFIAKFNSAGVRQWGSYYGASATGVPYTWISAIVTDDRGQVYIWGTTAAPSGISTPDAHKVIGGSSYDAFMAVFTGSGKRLYGTYYGGTATENLYDMPFTGGYAKGRVTFSAYTSSNDGIATPGAHQTARSLGDDAFLVQFATDTLVYIRQPFADTVICHADSLHIPYGTQLLFKAGNSFTFQLSDASGSFTTPTTLGSVTGQTGGVFAWQVPVTTTPGSGYRVRVLASAPSDTAYEEADIRILQQITPSVTITGTDSGAWPGLNVDFQATPVNGGNNPTYKWSVNNGYIIGAITDKWSTTTLSDGDSVCVEMYSSERCPNLKVVKACKQVKIATGIKDISNTNITLSPNPFSKQLIVSHAQLTISNIQLIDIYGRVVYTQKPNADKTTINTANLPSGNYMLVLTSADGKRVLRKVVKAE